MVAKEIQTLQKIADTGDCELIGEDPCSRCPLARLKKRPDESGWLSCYEAIAGPDFENIREKYKIAAKSKLIEMAIESAITDDPKKMDN